MVHGYQVISIIFLLQMYNRAVMEQELELDSEKMKTEKAFQSFLPKHVFHDVKKRKVRKWHKVLNISSNLS